MKSRYINILVTLQAVTISVVVSSCSEDIFNRDDFSHSSDNMIKFEVSSGFTSQATSRSSAESNNDADLPPVVFSEGNDTLYIHRYVGLESERTTGHRVAAISRGMQINDLDAFKTYCNDFYVQATYADDNSAYIPFSKAEPLASDQSGDVWYIKDPRYYWPVQRQLLFNAYAPSSAKDLIKGLDLGSETVSFSYIVPVSTDDPRVDAEKQHDIMFASTKCSRNDHDSYASLNFRHALSAIKFAVRDVASGEIVDISISGVAGSGSCVFNPEAESAPAFTWSNLGEKTAEYKQTFNYGTTVSDIDDIPSLENATVINDLEGMNDKTFMLIPQDIPDEAELKITFKKADETIKILKGKLKTPDIPKWEAGKEYVYTISTSAEVWNYVFKVTGSIQDINEENPSKGVFHEANDSIVINPTVTDGAYYNVVSYRQRKNNPSIIEPIAWTATSSDGVNQSSGNTTIQNYITQYVGNISMTLSPDTWLPEIGLTEVGSNLTMDKDGKFADDGSSVEGKQYKVKFKTQYVATDWKGDWQMRAKDTIGSKSNPIDLSLSNCGGARTTANCYVVNRGGWYKFPLVYGNAITNGNTNYSSFNFNGGPVEIRKTESSSWSYPPLSTFTDYKEKGIQGPNISGAESAILVWQDAYDIIDNISLDTSKTPNELTFRVRRNVLQQSNSVIAVRDNKGDIIWSWHIWVNETMVDDNQKLVGGIECETWNSSDEKYGPFEVALRNLGWCDPKNIAYLERTGSLTFCQVGGKTPDKTLKVRQRGKHIIFYIGNNTYYQWGRKDPMVGFRYSDGSDDYVKYNFGELPYDFMSYNNALISDGIKNPNCLLAGTDETDRHDWLSSGHYYNLWNNYAGSAYLQKNGDYNVFEPVVRDTPLPTLDYAYSAVKTVYDPSPAGFVVPPQKFFELFTKGRNRMDDAENQNLWKSVFSDVFNGTRELKTKYYQYKAYPNRSGNGEASILLTGTGQRWHRTGHPIFPIGCNMNPNMVYLWSNGCSFLYDHGNFSTVVGEENGMFFSTTRFLGRKSIARPIRCVKEYTPKTLGR